MVQLFVRGCYPTVFFTQFTTIQNQKMNSDEIKKALTALVEGLSFSSESDYPLELQDWGNKTDEQVKEAIAALHANGFPVQQISCGDFFSKTINALRQSGDAQMGEMAKRYEALEQFINCHAQSSAVYRCGRIEVGVYIVMRLPEGNLLVLKTISVET